MEKQNKVKKDYENSISHGVKMTKKLKLYFLIFIFVSNAGYAQEATNILPELNPDLELLQKIKDMPDNTWMKLPKLKITGDLGSLASNKDYLWAGPFVRDYCNKMVWAPDRKRALYTGGGHNTHPQNDVWEFDLASNTWVCLYGADQVPPRFAAEKESEGIAWYKENSILKNNFITTLKGAPLRPCHTWWAISYDTDRKQLLFLESHKGFFCVDKNLLARAHNIETTNPILKTYGSGTGEAWLFSFDPQKKEWLDVETKIPKSRESSNLEYIPDTKSLFWASGKTYVKETQKKEWEPLPKAGFGGGGMTAYDPYSKKIVGINGKETWVFDFASKEWQLLSKESPDGSYVPLGTFCFDSVAKKFILYTYWKTNEAPDGSPRLWTIDSNENKWEKPSPQGEFPKIGNIAGYYDVERNVTVIYSAKETWVYRCKN